MSGGSAFDDLREIVPLRIWNGVVGRAVAGKEATLAAIDLEPDTAVPEHRHVNEQTGILLRGTLEFRIGEETKELAPGAMWVIPADVPHSVHAGPEGAFLVELFAPPRDDWAGLERLEPSAPPGF
jgi:quercetin dioxygenase-like cupin family protein